MLTHVAGGAGQVAGHDVPADASVGQVVEGAQTPCERIGVLEGGAGGDAEAEVLGDRRHRAHEQDRVVHGNLCAVADRRLVGAAVDVVGAEHIGDEDAVEGRALEQLRKIRPVRDGVVLARAVIRVSPQTGRLVGDAVHVEGVEADLTGHGVKQNPRRRPVSAPATRGDTFVGRVRPGQPRSPSTVFVVEVIGRGSGMIVSTCGLAFACARHQTTNPTAVKTP